jgi:hypothetical protein
MTMTSVMTSVCGFTLFVGPDQVHDAWAARARGSAAPATAARKRDVIEHGSKDKPWRLPD